MKTQFKSRSLSPFYHFIIQSWIRAYPEDFIKVMKEHRKWEWLNSKNWFIQVEWRHDFKDRNPMFYDLYMKGNSPQDPYKYYHIFIEIKTSLYNEKWLDHLKEKYKYISNAGLKYKIDDNHSVLLWIAKEEEILKLVDEISDQELVQGLINDKINFFQIEYLEPYVYKDLNNLLNDITRRKNTKLKDA